MRAVLIVGWPLLLKPKTVEKQIKIMKEQIDYIKERVDKSGNVSIYTGKLTKKQETDFGKHFKVTRQPFGYTSFTNK